MWISAFTPRGAAPTLHTVLYLAEFYLPEDASLPGVVRKARAGACRAEAEVRFVRAIFVPRDESCFALYLAASADEVTAAGALAGLAFDRVLEALTCP